MVDDAAIAAVMARAQRYAAEARAEAEDDLARIRRENPEFAQPADSLRALCGGRVTYLHEFATGKTWGATAEERVRAAGGIGVSVPASIPMRKRGKRAARQHKTSV